MNFLLKYMFFLFMTGYCFAINGQSNKKFKPAINFDAKIPIITNNESLKEYAQPVSDLCLFFQYPTNNFVIGAGFKHTLLNIDRIKVTDLAKSDIHYFTPQLKLGYQKHTSDYFHYDLSVKFGYSMINYTTFECMKENYQSYRATGFSIEPQVGLYLVTDENLAIGFIISYAGIDDYFNPEDYCIDYFVDSSTKTQNGITQMMNFGLGFSTFL